MTNDIDEERLTSARLFAEKFISDMDHAIQVAHTALALFDITKGLHGLGTSERFLLHAAALVHDCGYQKNPPRHHKVGRDLIMENAITGFSLEERMVLACLTRYHRKAHPDKQHRVYRDLDAQTQYTVCQLAAILRIADGLDNSHTGTTDSLRVMCQGKVLSLYVRQCTPNPNDIYAATRKGGLFEQIFDVKLQIIAE